MISCSTCGAELQNPFDRMAETAIKWLGIHTMNGHKLEKLSLSDNALLRKIKIRWKATHNEMGRRKAVLNSKQRAFYAARPIRRKVVSDSNGRSRRK